MEASVLEACPYFYIGRAKLMGASCEAGLKPIKGPVAFLCR